MDLASAIEKQAEWKLKLRSAMLKMKRWMPAPWAKDNCCELSKWLHGAAKQLFRLCQARHVSC
jgi:hypothetical protein